jgi:UDPglucose 6-dehydrogenase
VPLRVVTTVAEVNQRRKRAMADRVAAALGGSVKGKTIAILGLTFKPNTDDMRESPALDIIAALEQLGARVRAYDPAGMEAARPLLPAITYAVDPYDCAKDADALVIVTEWEAFRALNLQRLKAALRQPIIVDLRNIYPPAEMRARGFVYRSIGRSTRDARRSGRERYSGVETDGLVEGSGLSSRRGLKKEATT